MKPIVFFMRRLVIILVLAAPLAVGGVLGLSKVGVDILPPRYMRKSHVSADYTIVKAMHFKEFIAGKFESYFHKHEEKSHQEQNTIVVTSPKARDVVITKPYVCQIHSRRHINVCALEDGYLKAIPLKEGQEVKEGDVMFEVLPILYKAKWASKVAERDLAQLEFNNTKRLAAVNGVSQNEVKLFEAKLARTQAEADLALAELNFATLRAPFDGIVDRIRVFQGGLVNKGDVLTSMSDNVIMWVYFNVPEKDYLEYRANRKQHEKEDRIELMLASGETFPQPGTIGAIEADFNNENGNIKFRADFPNPDNLLRNGQTGTIKIRRPLKNALVIPQRATFDILDKRYVWVVGDDHVAHQTLITVEHELEDIFVIKSGLKEGDKIVLEGVREVVDGEKFEYEFRKPEAALKDQKFHAE